MLIHKGICFPSMFQARFRICYFHFRIDLFVGMFHIRYNALVVLLGSLYFGHGAPWAPFYYHDEF